MQPSLRAVIATLELAGYEHPEILDFQVDLLFNSALRPAMAELASLFGVELRRVGVTVYQACLDLAKLERTQRWRDPREVVDSPNLAALHHVCRARAARAQGYVRRRKLEGISRKIEEAYDHARIQTRIEGFIGPRHRRKRRSLKRRRKRPGAEQK